MAKRCNNMMCYLRRPLITGVKESVWINNPHTYVSSLADVVMKEELVSADAHGLRHSARPSRCYLAHQPPILHQTITAFRHYFKSNSGIRSSPFSSSLVPRINEQHGHKLTLNRPCNHKDLATDELPNQQRNLCSCWYDHIASGAQT